MSAHFSNGTEGYAWMANWCDRCERDHQAHIDNHGDGCPIILREFLDEPVPEFIENWDGVGPFPLGDNVHCIEFRPCVACGGDGGDDERPPRIPIHPDQGLLFDAGSLPPGVPAGVLQDVGLSSVLNPPESLVVPQTQKTQK